MLTRIKKSSSSLYLALVLALTLVACSTTDDQTPSFTLAVTPEVLTVPQGTSAEVTVTVNRRGGFGGEVTLAVINAPSGVTVPETTVTGDAESATVRVEVSPTATVASRPVTVQGTSELTKQQISFTLDVVAGTSAPSSFDLIEEAFGRGEISYETALSYKVYAVFGDEALPTAYQSGVRNLGGSGLMYELKANFSQLSAEVQTKLQPFLLNPSEPGSWYELRNGQSTGLKTAAIQWGTLAGQTAKVKVWWDKGNFPQDEAKAQQIVAALDSTIWPKLTGLMGEPLPDCGASCSKGGGDSRLDIYLVFINGAYGLTPNFDNPPSPAYISVDRTINNQDLLFTTVAHEFMHAIQWAYLKTDFDEYDWLFESTATWAEDFVYPTANTEHGYALSFLSTTDLSLEAKQKKHDPRTYGAYLFFFYLERKLGQPELIRKLWERASFADSLAALDSVIPGGFAARWSEFARLNYNNPPILDYEAWDGLKLFAKVSNKQVDVTDAAERPIPANVKHLAALYYHFTFPNEKIHSIRFDIPFSTGQWPTAKVEALVKIAGQDWRTEDWTTFAKKTFCREKPEEKLEAITLIISNSEWQDRNHQLGAGDLKLGTAEDCLKIERIEGPPVLFFGGPEGQYQLHWKGEPTFPVQMIFKTVSCELDSCAPETSLEKETEENPLTFTSRCVVVGTGDKPPKPGSVVYEVVLKDSAGLESPPYSFTFACQNGGSLQTLGTESEISGGQFSIR
jgi:hypothetical protein